MTGIVVRGMSMHGGRRPRPRELGPVLLMPAAAFGVHQLRYYLAFGSAAGAVLQRTGHSYLHSFAPWIVGLVALAAGGFLRSLGRAAGGQRSLTRFAASLAGLWLTCSACLVAIFAAQELLEGLLATGHPAGLIGIFGYGGWWSIPAALCIGLVLAALFHGARWVLDEVTRRRALEPSRSAVRPALLLRSCGVPVPRPAPLADGWSGRGPPIGSPVCAIS
jgi:hypothetical protein